MTDEKKREQYIQEVLSILSSLKPRKLTAEEIACVIVLDVILPALEEEKALWLRLAYAESDIPQ